MVHYQATIEDIVKEGTYAEVEMACQLHPKHMRDMSEMDEKLRQVKAKFQSQVLDQEPEQSWRS